MMLAYSTLMVLAVGTGFVLSRRTQSGLNLSVQQRWAIALGAFCGSMIGAKLPFVLADWNGLLSGRAWFDNGKTIVFGFVGGYFGVELVKTSLAIRVKTGDTFAVPVAGAVAVGRLACFSAGCCFGRSTTLPWGVDFGDGVHRHPTQLYEFFFHASMAFVLAEFARRRWLDGQRIKFYILAYLVFRFFTEWIRPEPLAALGLTGYQWAILTLIPVLIALWLRDRNVVLCNSGSFEPSC